MENLSTNDKALVIDVIYQQLIKDGVLSVDRDGYVYNDREHQIGYLSECGYVRLDRKINGKRLATRAHRVVWNYFNGPIPKGLFINHINGNKSDNRLVNLELVTGSENAKHAKALPQHQGKVNLTPEEHTLITTLYEHGVRRVTLAEMFDVSYWTICCIVNKRTDVRHPRPTKNIELAA